MIFAWLSVAVAVCACQINDGGRNVRDMEEKEIRFFVLQFQKQARLSANRGVSFLDAPSVMLRYFARYRRHARMALLFSHYRPYKGIQI